MGAQAARVRHQEDGELPKKGMTNATMEESEPCDAAEEVAMAKPLRVSRTFSFDSPGKVAQLEEQLLLENRTQEDERDRMHLLVEPLETVIERQVSMTESEHEWITMLEHIMDQQQRVTEEKVAKLLVAVAGEKRRADMAEQEHLDLERKHKAVVEELSRELEISRATSSSTDMDELESWDDLEKQLQAECALRIQAEQRIVGLELQVKTLQQESEKLTTEAVERQHARATSLNERDIVGESVETQSIAEVVSQYQNEMAKRMDVQNKLLQKNQQVRELQRQVDDMREVSGLTSRVPSCDGELLAVQEAKRQRFELAKKESQLQELQQRLGCELTKRAQLQGQVVEKSKQHQGAQTQLLQKTREVCDLQAKLIQELPRRQSVQYKVIEKERVIYELQQQLMTARGASNNSTERSIVRPSSALRELPVGGVGDGSIYDFGMDGAVSPASPSEPEGEDSTCAGADSPCVQPVIASPPIGGFGPPIPLGEQSSMMPSVQSTRLDSLRVPPAFESPAFMPHTCGAFRTVTMSCNSSTSMQEVRGSSTEPQRNQHNTCWRLLPAQYKGQP